MRVATSGEKTRYLREKRAFEMTLIQNHIETHSLPKKPQKTQNLVGCCLDGGGWIRETAASGWECAAGRPSPSPARGVPDHSH